MPYVGARYGGTHRDTRGIVVEVVRVTVNHVQLRIKECVRNSGKERGKIYSQTDAQLAVRFAPLDR